MEARVVHLDTHVVVWLYSGLVELIPKPVTNAINKNSLMISPIVALEIQYLYETGRVSASANQILEDLDMRVGLKFDKLTFARVIRQSILEKWTRDPFDRLIVAQARIRQVSLLTKDRTIRKHYKRAKW